MNRIIYIIMILIMVGCSSNSQDQQQDQNYELPTETFNPVPGMSLQSLVDIPSITWSFDTIRGVCAPDTFLLWMSYADTDYLTNVIGVKDNFPMLTDNGMKRISKDLTSTAFIKTDFKPQASLYKGESIAHSEFRQLNDSLYRKSVNEMTGIARDFFSSLGMPKYMSSPLAANWRQIYAQAEVEGVEAPNPLNRRNIIEIDSSSITIDVVDASKGILEVSAYCYDPYTVGAPGWAYWTVTMCREGRFFKVKEMPAQHRRFTNG